MTLPYPAERVIALSQGSLEIVLALGGTVVGRPSLRGVVLPDTIQALPGIGNVVAPNLEALMQVRPDLVIAPAKAHGDVAERLQVLRTPLYLSQTKSVADVFCTIHHIGVLLGREEHAQALCLRLECELSELHATIPKTYPRTLLLFGTPQAFLVITAHTFAGDILRLAGGENVAADIVRQNGTQAEHDMEYLPLSLEAIAVADPEVICVVSHGDRTIIQEALQKELGTHPAWQALTAVKQGRVYVLPADALSADPGPDFPRAVRLLIEVLHGQRG